jgi:type I restriction enzyme S subunit
MAKVEIETWNPQREEQDDFFKYIDISSVNQESKQIGEWKRVRSSEAPSRARQLVCSEDVLVSTVRPNLNGVAQVPLSLHGAIVSTGFCVLRTNAILLIHIIFFIG